MVSLFCCLQLKGPCWAGGWGYLLDFGMGTLRPEPLIYFISLWKWYPFLYLGQKIAPLLWLEIKPNRGSSWAFRRSKAPSFVISAKILQAFLVLRLSCHLISSTFTYPLVYYRHTKAPIWVGPAHTAQYIVNPRMARLRLCMLRAAISDFRAWIGDPYKMSVSAFQSSSDRDINHFLNGND